MPRRVPPPQAVDPIINLQPPPPLSPLVHRLRTDWRWAAVSQFIWMFSDAFGFADWDIENLEMDLDGDETALLPDLLAKLLYALTYNRQINRENAMEHLRKQYAKRAPDDNVLGTFEEPIGWGTLGVGQKVQILWELCEWQMNDPARFRALLKSEEESVSWRIDPLGWDKLGNTYYLFDDNRLWIQRLPPPPPRPPRPPKKSSLKAKKSLKLSRPPAPPKRSHSKRQPSPLPTPPPIAEEQPVASGSRKRTQVAFYGNPTSTVEALKRGGRTNESPSTVKSTRSSTRHAAPMTPSPIQIKPLPTGTRMSRRFRDVEDEWQQVPEEWLKPATRKGKARSKQDEEEESELSELTDEEEYEARLGAMKARTESGDEDERMDVDPPSKAIEDEQEEVEGEKEGVEEAIDEDVLSPVPDEPDKQKEPDEVAETEDVADVKHETNGHAPQESGKAEVEDDADRDAPPQNLSKGSQEPEQPEELEVDTDEVKLAVEEAMTLPPGFVEWEAVCVTLYDWRTFPEQFATSRDPDERTLYHTLSQQVGPTVIDALVVKEQERLKQEAIVNRKRSSRIATRELEREEIVLRERAHREMEERMDRSRREETRAAREEAEMIARERAREDRLKEREDRAAAREEAAMARIMADATLKEEAERAREKRAQRRRDGDSVDTVDEAVIPSVNLKDGRVNGTDGWELNCEVCRTAGWNLADDADVVCCDDCGRWQHVACHDRQDRAEGRPKRNWDKVDFKCKECRRREARKRRRLDEEVVPAAPVLSVTSIPTSQHGKLQSERSTLSNHLADPTPMVNGHNTPYSSSNGQVNNRSAPEPSAGQYHHSHAPEYQQPPARNVLQHLSSTQPHPQQHPQYHHQQQPLQHQHQYPQQHQQYAHPHPTQHPNPHPHDNAMSPAFRPNALPATVPHAASHPFAPRPPHMMYSPQLQPPIGQANQPLYPPQSPQPPLHQYSPQSQSGPLPRPQESFPNQPYSNHSPRPMHQDTRPYQPQYSQYPARPLQPSPRPIQYESRSPPQHGPRSQMPIPRQLPPLNPNPNLNHVRPDTQSPAERPVAPSRPYQPTPLQHHGPA